MPNMLRLFEAHVTTIDGEHEYTRKLYCYAKKEGKAHKHFGKEVGEDFDAENYEELGRKRGWWDADHTTYTYIETIYETRGLLISVVGGQPMYLDLTKNWKKKYEDYKHNLKRAISTLPLRRSDPGFEELYTLESEEDDVSD